MEHDKIVVRKIDSLRELENLVVIEQIILCDEIQNTFLLLELYHNKKIGVAYYDYGVPPDFCHYNNQSIYIGLGVKLLCIDVCKNKVVLNHTLQSVFYELLLVCNQKYLCVICELNIYCYLGFKKKWSQGFRNIINSYKIIDDTDILIHCDDNTEYLFSAESGEILNLEQI